MSCLASKTMTPLAVLIGYHCVQDAIKLRAVFGNLLKGGYIEGEK